MSDAALSPAHRAACLVLRAGVAVCGVDLALRSLLWTVIRATAASGLAEDQSALLMHAIRDAWPLVTCGIAFWVVLRSKAIAHLVLRRDAAPGHVSVHYAAAAFALIGLFTSLGALPQLRLVFDRLCLFEPLPILPALAETSAQIRRRVHAQSGAGLPECGARQ